MRLQFKPVYCPILVTLLCLTPGLLPEGGEDLLQYQRTAVQTNEWWRLITAHFVHLGWEHLLMNLAGLWLIWHLFVRHENALTGCAFRLPLLALGTSLGLLWLTPEVSWYRGLSGVLHGLLITSLLHQASIQPRSSIALLSLIMTKIAWEQLSGPLPGSESWVAGRVIVDAHLYGGISGVLIWGIERGYSQLRHHEVTG
ncbi:MAG: rhombosortase [Candidatus Thiodiazotropha sp. (ex Monitilora ramsayi)]|nr:rhombosortase [Candidatus Thiodiazotropha sp. (ex Monitilora ramsayi)]